MGQSWINTPFIEYLLPSTTQDTSTVGPQEICITPDNQILMLLQPDQDHAIWLMKYDSSGSVLWSKRVAGYYSLSNEIAFDLHPTMDNGCIYAYRYYGSMSIQDSVNRRSSYGNLIWSINNIVPYGSNEVVMGVTQTFYNTTIIQFRDSLVEVDSAGHYIRSRTPFSMYARIVQLPDSNILVFDSSNVIKQDFFGNPQWSIHFPAQESALCSNSPFIYINNGNDSVAKLNTQNGNILWTHNISISTITPTKDQGFIGVDTNDLQKYDSTGVLMWSKTFDFPEYGLKGMAEMQDKSIITGGCWKMLKKQNPYTSYCPFVMQIDSTASGIVDSSDFFYPGNANDNNLLSFADDAVYVAAAMNNSGIRRENILVDTATQTPPTHFLFASLYAIDWSTGFSAGYNYKYADVNGNGVIDTIDLQILSYLYPYPGNNGGHSHWNRLSNTTPDLYFHIPNSQPITDNLEVDIILGSTTTLIDSIYGLSIDFYFRADSVPNYNPFPRSYLVPQSLLGDSAIDLYTYFSCHQNDPPGRTTLVLCRNNHLNVSMYQDTIAKVFFDLSSLSNINDTLRIMSSANAITAGGFPVTLNILNDSALLAIPLNANPVDENQSTILLSPNPASDYLRLELKHESEIETGIFNLLGKSVLFNKSKGKTVQIDISSLSNGVYFLRCNSEKNSVVRKFIINR